MSGSLAIFTTNLCLKVFVSAAEMRKAQGKKARQNKEATKKLTAQRISAKLQAAAPMAPNAVPHEGNIPRQIHHHRQLSLTLLSIQPHQQPAALLSVATALLARCCHPGPIQVLTVIITMHRSPARDTHTRREPELSDSIVCCDYP